MTDLCKFIVIPNHLLFQRPDRFWKPVRSSKSNYSQTIPFIVSRFTGKVKQKYPGVVILKKQEV